MARPCVLVVDDEPDFQQFLEILLEDAGYDIAAADSAIGARAIARRLQPRAILLDLGLPYQSGVSLLGELKADPGMAHIPVIVISGMPDALEGPTTGTGGQGPQQAVRGADPPRCALHRALTPATVPG